MQPFLSVFLLFFISCASYKSKTEEALYQYEQGKYQTAIDILKPGAEEDSVDQLLYVLDRATNYHHLQNYQLSNADFHLADKLSEIKDYTSLSTEALTLISNDQITQYKGETFETVLISQYLALNYLMMGAYEDALVECRRVNHKIYRLNFEGKQKYNNNPMALYLSAMIYESQKEYDDAYVDYQQVYRLLPSFKFLKEDLFRLAYLTKNKEDQEKWVKVFHLSDSDKKTIIQSILKPELVFLFEVGKSPEKIPHPNWHSIPKYVPRENPIHSARISINEEKEKELALGDSEELYNIEATAIKNFDDKYARIIAKKIAGVVAKEVIGNQVGKKTKPILGDLLKIGLYIADRADLRSWLTLPKSFQIFRYRFHPTQDTLTITIQPKNLMQQNIGSRILKSFQFTPKQKIIFSIVKI